jgi:ARG and Rhodanese-Phosphatase-superfamily-associated Protein domain
MEQIKSFLEISKVARKRVHKNLTVFPLLAPNGIEPEYLILEQALDKKLIRITELDTEGSVPELKLKNLGKKSVLIIEGEELVGAKQNRIVNSSFLIAGKTEVVIPVSCVEQGRWSYRSESFVSGKRMMHASLRRAHQEDVKYSLKQGRGYRSDQGRIWNNISEKIDRMEVPSSTGAMADVYESHEDLLSEFLKQFQLIELQVGAVFAINGKILGLEGFGCHDTFSRFFEKLVKSYALDALDSRSTSRKESLPPDKARRFIASAIKSKGERHPSIGLGENITFESRIVSGAALVESNRLLCISAFKKEKESDSSGVGFQRYSHRRNRRII